MMQLFLFGNTRFVLNDILKNTIFMRNRNLFVYACSHGKLGTVSKNVDGYPQNKFIDKGSFGDLLAKKLDFNLINRSQPGSCNFRIFNSILGDINNNVHTKDDLCVVQWTHIDRAWSSTHFTLMPHIENQSSKIYYSDLHNELQSLSMMVGFNLYVQSKIKTNVVYSFADHTNVLSNVSKHLSEDFIRDAVIVDNMSPRQLVEYRNIEHKNLLFPCWHASELGHEFISEIYLEQIHKIT